MTILDLHKALTCVLHQSLRNNYQKNKLAVITIFDWTKFVFPDARVVVGHESDCFDSQISAVSLV